MKFSGAVLLMAAVCVGSSGQREISGGSQQPSPTLYAPVHNFDPKRDATADIQAAVTEAQKTGKRIIVDVGGNWCAYCHEMDELFRRHSELVELRDKNFITVPVYYGPDNKNQKALSRYSKLLGVPHFYVLEKNGSLLHSQHVLELRTGGQYDPAKMKAFLLQWSPADTGSSAARN